MRWCATAKATPRRYPQRTLRWLVTFCIPRAEKRFWWSLLLLAREACWSSRASFAPGVGGSGQMRADVASTWQVACVEQWYRLSYHATARLCFSAERGAPPRGCRCQHCPPRELMSGFERIGYCELLPNKWKCNTPTESQLCCNRRS